MRPTSRTAVLGRALVLLAFLVAAAWAVARLAADPLRALRSAVAHDRVGSLPLEDALAAVCAVALVAAAGWLAVVGTLVIGEAVLHSLRGAAPARLRSWGCPASLRRLLLGCCGVALGTGLAVAPASGNPAEPPPAAPGAGTAPGAQVALAGLSVPDRVLGGPVGRSAPAPDIGTDACADRRPDACAHRRPARSDARPRWVTVSPGDTLWGLAARALPADASDAEITVAWHRLYAANRPTVGPDPDLILPGADLRLPVPLSHPGEERP